jgi:uncharacterized phage protein (TIGR02220 family)
MTIYSRSVNTGIWKDPKFVTLAPLDKLIFIHLLTNDHTNILGCFEITIRDIAHDTMISEMEIKKSLEKLSSNRMITIDDLTSELMVMNWSKYNWNKKQNVDNVLLKCFPSIKSPVLKKHLFDKFSLRSSFQSVNSQNLLVAFGSDISSSTSSTSTSDVLGYSFDLIHKESIALIPVVETCVCVDNVEQVIDYLNEKKGSNFSRAKADNEALCKILETYSVEDCLFVIETKYSSWAKDSKMHEFLRPSTLFKKENFANYLNERRPRSAIEIINSDHQRRKNG